MSYNTSSKLSTMKYLKSGQHEIKFRYKNDEYENTILPAIKRSGLPVATYIKRAISEKIAADAIKEKELLSILERVKAIVIKSIPAIFDGNVQRIILYGSYARGDFTEDSDIDIAIMTDTGRQDCKKYDEQVDELASEIGIETLAIVNFACLPYEEYENKKEWYPYYRNIAKDGIVLYER